jgi:hypothetical protein
MEDFGTKIAFGALEGVAGNDAEEEGEEEQETDAAEALGSTPTWDDPDIAGQPLLRLSSAKLKGERGVKLDLKPTLLQKGQVDTASAADCPPKKLAGFSDETRTLVLCTLT